MNVAPIIIAQPVSSTVCSGTNTTFGVTAVGTGLTYYWQVSTDGGSTWNSLSNGGVYSNVLTATMSITGATTGMNGYRYRVIVSGTCSPSVTSNAVLLTVNSLPAITVQPVARTICVGASTTFGVTATGTGLSYQWQVNTDMSRAGWTNLTNVAPYSNVTTATMSITSATAGMTSYVYRVVVSGTCSPSVTSNNVGLTVNTLSTIPTSASASPSTINPGGSLTLSYVGGTLGTGGVAKWYKGSCGGTLVGQGNSLSIAPTCSSSADLTYYVRFEGTCGNTACKNTTIAINEYCNSLDDDCDSSTDEGCDDDNDNYCDSSMVVVGTPNTCTAGGNDCNDGNSSIHPGTTELCNNVDDNCDWLIDNNANPDAIEVNNVFSTSLPSMGTYNDCVDYPDGGIPVTGLRLGKQSDGSADVDWVRALVEDHSFCNIYPAVIITRPSGSDYRICAYFDCTGGNGKLKDSFSCEQGYKVYDGPDFDGDGNSSNNYGCCNYTASQGYTGVDAVELNPDCDSATSDDGFVTVKVFSPSGTMSCGSNYSLMFTDN